MNNNARKLEAHNAFLGNVAYVFLMLAMVFVAGGYLWSYFLSIWFDAVMSDPENHQYTLAFSLVLHLPAWVCWMLAVSFLTVGVVALTSVKISGLSVWKRCRKQKALLSKWRLRLTGSEERKS